MPLLVVADATLCLTPDPGWSWSAWNGKIALAVQNRKVRVCGHILAVEIDIPFTSRQLQGRCYTASGFDAVPGVVVGAILTVTGSTSSQLTSWCGKRVLLKTTTGKFTVQCSPSLNPSGSPDPCPLRTGRWVVEEANQAPACSSR
jgi:hypothetical protein